MKFALLLLLALCSNTSCFAVDVFLPNGKAKAFSGLSLHVSHDWSDHFGYQPIRFTFTSPKPTLADQTITVQVQASEWQQTGMSVSQTIEMPAGATTISGSVAVPMYAKWPILTWEVFVDNTFEPTLSKNKTAASMMGWAGAGWGNSQNDSLRVFEIVNKTNNTLFPPKTNIKITPQILRSISDNTALDVIPYYPTQSDIANGKVSINGIPMKQFFNTNSLQSILNSIATNTNSWANRTMSSINELPNKWVDYSSYDVVSISLADLITLRKQNPKGLQTLQEWVSTGGFLFISEMPFRRQKQGEEGVAQVQRILGLQQTSASVATTGMDTAWLSLRAFFNRHSDFSLPALQLNKKRRTNPIRNSTNGSIRLYTGATIARDFGFGAICCSGTQKSSAMSVQSILNQFSTSGMEYGVNWTARHGISPNEIDGDFDRYLIPGIGLAPVTEFQILITLFVILIGPVNYWFLKKKSRLHLFVLTVPIFALAITLALMAYAVVSDGFGMRVRSRSFTLLDQRAEKAVSWARNSYYAGLAPSGGLEFSEDTAIYPIAPKWKAARWGNGVRHPNRSMEWIAGKEGKPGKQLLTEGWLASRTPTQYLIGSTTATKRRIVFPEIEDGGNSIDITNELGGAIELLLVRTKNGQVFMGEAIEDNTKANLKLVKDPKAAGILRKLLSKNEAEYPVGHPNATGNSGPRLFGINRRNRFSSIYIGDYSKTPIEMQILMLKNSTGVSSRPLHIQERQYIAILRSNPLVQMGVSSFSEDASFHIVVGSW